MKIKLFWSKCNYLNNKWESESSGIDSYWVECKYWEAEKYVFPYLKNGFAKKIQMEFKESNNNYGYELKN